MHPQHTVIHLMLADSLATVTHRNIIHISIMPSLSSTTDYIVKAISKLQIVLAMHKISAAFVGLVLALASSPQFFVRSDVKHSRLWLSR